MHSDKVPYFILDLLQQVTSVHVPGLGRFEAIFHPAVIDFSQSKIKPPHIQPGFQVDGDEPGDLLPTYMHYVSGIDVHEAQGVIDDFVRNVNDRLMNDQSYGIEKFGTFSKSSAGILHFTPDWDAFNLSFRGLEEFDLDPPLTDAPPPKVYVVPEVKEFSYQPTPVVVQETNWVTDKEVERQKEITEEATIPKPADISDSTSRLWWIILATALVLITLLCAYLAWDILSNRDRLRTMAQGYNEIGDPGTMDDVETITDTFDTVNEAIPTETDSEQTTGEVIEPEENITEEKPVTPVDTTPDVQAPSDNASACFVVVGAFGDPANVARMVSRLQGMGYETEEMKGGTLTKVAIRTSCEQSSLQKVLTDARSSITPEAWIY